VSTYGSPARASRVSAPSAPGACPGGDGDGDVPAGDGLVVPLATGVGEGDGLVVSVGEGVVVREGLGDCVVVLVVGGVLRCDVAVVTWVEPPTTGAVLLDGVGLERDVRWLVVGVGVFCTVDGWPGSPEPF
jgi:hypothetical protein